MSDDKGKSSVMYRVAMPTEVDAEIQAAIPDYSASKEEFMQRCIRLGLLMVDFDKKGTQLIVRETDGSEREMTFRMGDRPVQDEASPESGAKPS